MQMNTITIEKGVPYPSMKVKSMGRGNASKYPLAQMAIGDSFPVPNERLVAVAIKNHNRRVDAKKKFIIGETNAGLRCWRVPMNWSK